MDPTERFQQEVARNIEALTNARDIRDLSRIWLRDTLPYRYSYNFAWLGRPIIQYPQDMVAIQELIWQARPDLIIETGIAHGGSLILSASMLALLDYCDAVTSGDVLNPAASRRRVVGVDIDIRLHNRMAIESHPLGHKIDLIQGSSISKETVSEVRDRSSSHQCVMVFLDSNHTHEHVLAELNAYAPLVTQDSYCVVFDTVIEQLPDSACSDRPWGRGNNPMTAVQDFLTVLATENISGADGDPLRFDVDTRIDGKLLVSVAPSGYLRRVKRTV
jgi:cephalosporin hydroxylase